MDHSQVLTPEHHAVLFALMVRNLSVAAPDLYRAVTKAAVCRYGFERGRRMSSKAISNGDDLRAEHYLCYSEWRSSDYKEQRSHVSCSDPYTLEVESCCWCEAWKKYQLTQWGNLYCEDVDEALTIGFNPEYPLKITSTLSKGDPVCRFVYPTIHMDEKTKSYIAGKKKKLQDSALKDFSYHTAHLYFTFIDEAERRLGVTGRLAVSQALNDFCSIFGKPAGEIINQYQNEIF